MRWSDLCDAPKKHFRDNKKDEDIHKAIRNRKQCDREDFEKFYEAVEQLMVGLSIPLSKATIVDMVSRNLRSDIRHELLNVSIRSFPLF